MPSQPGWLYQGEKKLYVYAVCVCFCVRACMCVYVCVHTCMRACMHVCVLLFCFQTTTYQICFTHVCIVMLNYIHITNLCGVRFVIGMSRTKNKI